MNVRVRLNSPGAPSLEAAAYPSIASVPVGCRLRKETESGSCQRFPVVIAYGSCFPPDSFDRVLCHSILPRSKISFGRTRTGGCRASLDVQTAVKQISVLLTDRGYFTYCARRDARRSRGRSPGRNYTEVVDTIREFMRRGVIIKTVINGMTFNGSTTNPKQIRLVPVPNRLRS